MTEIILKYAAFGVVVGGVVVWIAYVLKRVPILENNQIKLSKKVNDQGENIIGMKTTIDQHEKRFDRLDRTLDKVDATLNKFIELIVQGKL